MIGAMAGSSIALRDSVLSMASHGSGLSVGSVGSVLSVGSIGSAASWVAALAAPAALVR
jgi:hypothetical protein